MRKALKELASQVAFYKFSTEDPEATIALGF